MMNEEYVHSEKDRELIKRFSGFMKKSVMYARSDYLRTLSYRQQEVLVDIQDEEVVEDQYPSLQEGFDFQEEKIAKAFSELSLVKQKILIHSFVDRLSSQEIADRLGCSLNFVYNHKYLALKRLRQELEKGGTE